MFEYLDKLYSKYCTLTTSQLRIRKCLNWESKWVSVKENNHCDLMPCWFHAVSLCSRSKGPGTVEVRRVMVCSPAEELVPPESVETKHPECKDAWREQKVSVKQEDICMRKMGWDNMISAETVKGHLKSNGVWCPAAGSNLLQPTIFFTLTGTNTWKEAVRTVNCLR